MRFNVKNNVETTAMLENQINGNKFYIYYGECDGKKTQWICKTEWNYNINVHHINGDLKYSDDNEEEIYVFEDEEIIDFNN